MRNVEPLSQHLPGDIQAFLFSTLFSASFEASLDGKIPILYTDNMKKYILILGWLFAGLASVQAGDQGSAAPQRLTSAFQTLHKEAEEPARWGIPFRTGIVNGFLGIEGIYNKFPQEWDRFRAAGKSSLRSFSQDRFAFLVHAGSSPKKMATMKLDPKWLCRVLAFSASLIDQDHRNTYGRYGFIISAPSENILAAKESDMGTPFAKMFRADQKQDLESDPTFPWLISSNLPSPPEEILARTRPSAYSEIMVAGTTTNGGPVKIIGMFIKTKNGLATVSPDLEQEILEFSRQLKVPTIRIEAASEREF